MNKERKGRFNDVISSLEEAKGEVEDILNEEQDSYDSLPDSCLAFAINTQNSFDP